jgi:two-component system phosphate regulon sensor histidine kinase PhoR
MSQHRGPFRGKVMRGLYPKMLFLVGSFFAVILVAMVVLITVASNRQIEQIWLARSRTLNQMAFEALYASLSHGGGVEGNQQVIARLEEIGVFTDVHVVRGGPLIQPSSEIDANSLDDLERRAMAGEEVGAVQREGNQNVVRYITPIRMEAECLRCHDAEVGTISGVISTQVALGEYEGALRRQRNLLLLGVAVGMLALGVVTFHVLQQLVIHPLHAIRQGAAAIAKGNLDYRLSVATGDEMETVAHEFNHMAEQLQASYGQIAEEQDRILAAIEASRDAIWISDSERQVVTVNSAMERLLGQDRSQILGRTCHDILRLYDPSGASICDRACAFLDGSADSGRVEGYVSTKHGAVWADISYGRITDAEGRMAGGVHIVHDLTEHREIEQLKDEFIATVSHELRTPLNHIKGFATTLLQTDVEWDAVAQQDFMRSISQEADRLTNLVEKVLHLSRLETEGLPVEREWWQIDDIVDGALRRRRNVTAHHKIVLELEPDLPAVFVDGREIEVVLMNLIENAAQYSEPGTTIAIRAGLEDDEFVFDVADQGIGIAEEQQELIFERFYRVESEKHRAPGTGLGLAICKRIVKAHNGRIWVESALGSGSRFHFSLPLQGVT